MAEAGPNKDINHVAVVGGGLIGMSWACLFLARGKKVTVYDTRPDVGERLQGFIQQAWPYLERLGLVVPGASQDITFTTNMANLANVDFVQECVKDDLGVKQQVIINLENHIGPDVSIASSTSSLVASDIQEHTGIKNPERIFIAHPLNPPHLISQVEIVAGMQTNTNVMESAQRFYEEDISRDVIHVRQEMPGHLMNVFNSAVFGQAYELVAQGFAVEEVEAALTEYIGPRLSFLGLFQSCAANAGSGGFRGYVDQIYSSVQGHNLDLPRAEITADKSERVITTVEKALEDVDLAALSETRDDALVRLHELKVRVRQGAVQSHRDPEMAKSEIAGRFENAVFAVAYNAIAEGIASVEDVEKALQALSARWNFFGSLTTYAIGGGEAVDGGDAWFRKYMNTIGQGQAARLEALPDLNDVMNPENNNRVISEVETFLQQDVGTGLLGRGLAGLGEVKSALNLG